MTNGIIFPKQRLIDDAETSLNKTFSSSQIEALLDAFVPRNDIATVTGGILPVEHGGTGMDILSGSRTPLIPLNGFVMAIPAQNFFERTLNSVRVCFWATTTTTSTVITFVIATLPVGFRPREQVVKRIPVWARTGGTRHSAVVIIYPSGNIGLYLDNTGSLANMSQLGTAIADITFTL